MPDLSPSKTGVNALMTRPSRLGGHSAFLSGITATSPVMTGVTGKADPTIAVTPPRSLSLAARRGTITGPAVTGWPDNLQPRRARDPDGRPGFKPATDLRFPLSRYYGGREAGPGPKLPRDDSAGTPALNSKANVKGTIHHKMISLLS